MLSCTTLFYYFFSTVYFPVWQLEENSVPGLQLVRNNQQCNIELSVIWSNSISLLKTFFIANIIRELVASLPTWLREINRKTHGEPDDCEENVSADYPGSEKKGSAIFLALKKMRQQWWELIAALRQTRRHRCRKTLLLIHTNISWMKITAPTTTTVSFHHFHLRLLAVNVIKIHDLDSKPKKKNCESFFSRLVQLEQNLSVKPGGILLCSSSSSAKVGLSSRYCWASDQVVRYVTLAMLSKMFFRASQFLFLSCLACSWKQEEEEEEEGVSWATKNDWQQK